MAGSTRSAFGILRQLAGRTLRALDKGCKYEFA